MALHMHHQQQHHGAMHPHRQPQQQQQHQQHPRLAGVLRGTNAVRRTRGLHTAPHPLPLRAATGQQLRETASNGTIVELPSTTSSHFEPNSLLDAPMGEQPKKQFDWWRAW
jgi:hypothetical protein